MSDTDEVDSADIIRIMVATDNHLGYGEKDAIRGEDSFTAFEEILEMAVEEDVDFVLLGGDLFHEAAPSQNALNRCLKLLRRYTLGDKPIAVEFLSDQAQNFHDALNSTVNYEDPNINVSLPVFSIHGNHDDPSGFGRLSSLDLLSNTGLINYFGRWTDLTKIEISPILLRKGITQLALFGLSHIHDARLARLFDSDKVVIERPDPSTGDWFNLMVLHQNRAKNRGEKNYIPEERLPNFLHLVIWGHEHDCYPSPDYNANRDFYVFQPGSSVPTSLAEGEAQPKHVGILEIYKTKFQIKPMKLQTTRPFIFKTISLIDSEKELRLDEGDAANKVQEMAKQCVDDMIEQAKEQLTGHPKQPTQPLIRLRLEYKDEQQMFNTIRFGQQYNEKVANPADIVTFKKMVKKGKNEAQEFDKDAMHNVYDKMNIESSTRVEDIVDRYFDEVNEDKKLKLFSSKNLSESIARMVEHDDADAANQIFKFYKEKALDYLMEKLPNDDEINDALNNFKVTNVVTHEMVLKMLDSRGGKGSSKSKSSKTSVKLEDEDKRDFLHDDIDELSDEKEAPSSSRGRAKKETKTTTTTTRGRGRGRGRGAGRGSSAASNISNSSTKTAHAMPKLDVSIGSTRSSGRQQTLLDSISQRHTTRRGNKAPVYEISDDSD